MKSKCISCNETKNVRLYRDENNQNEYILLCKDCAWRIKEGIWLDKESE